MSQDLKYDPAFDQALLRSTRRPRVLRYCKAEWEAELQKDSIRFHFDDLLITLVYIVKGEDDASNMTNRDGDDFVFELPGKHGYNVMDGSGPAEGNAEKSTEEAEGFHAIRVKRQKEDVTVIITFRAHMDKSSTNDKELDEVATADLLIEVKIDEYDEWEITDASLAWFHMKLDDVMGLAKRWIIKLIVDVI